MQTSFKRLKLPIHDVLDTVKEALTNSNELVLEAAPGAGKTTIVPLALLEEAWLGEQKIIMLQPRRVAARASAERMAQLLNEKPGERVGYQIRQESKLSQHTRIVVMTEGVLIRQLQSDPSLEGVGLVIFDEFHERNLDSDLALTFCQESRGIFREEDNPLKLLIMSATLAGVNAADFLNGAKTIQSKGKSYPVDVCYSQPKAFQKNTQKDEMMVHALDSINQAILKHQGDILVFLPGQREIQTIQKQLQESLEKHQTNDIAIYPLYGGLSLEDQKRAIMPLPENTQYSRKVVLATDIAETSLTIEGITTVIDSGLAREPHYDPNTGITRLNTQQISKASSVQRAGRAGRLGPGTCYRLWPESKQGSLIEQRPAEILHSDLAPLVLQLLQWGIQNPEQTQWLTPPPASTYQQGVDLLQLLNAIELNGDSPKLTPHGKAMAKLPTHPRLAHMLLTAQHYGIAKLGADIAALMSERDPIRHYGVDMSTRLDIINNEAPCPGHLRSWKNRITQQSRAFAKLLKDIHAPVNTENQSINNEQGLGFLLCCAYPDRIGKQQAHGQYTLSNGRKATLPDDDPLCLSAWVVAADVGGTHSHKTDRIFLATNVDTHLFHSALNNLTRTEDMSYWDNQKERFAAERRTSIGALTWQSQTLKNIPPETISHALLQLIRERGLSLLPWTEENKQWQARIMLLRQYDNSHRNSQQEKHQDKDSNNKWPDVSDAALLENLENWLQPFLAGITSLSALKRMNLSEALSSILDWSDNQELNQKAPTKLLVPSGSHMAINYLHNPPVLSVKLQEMFGCKEAPSVVNGKVMLMVHLLSPAQRPLQVTQDLIGFWQNSYHDVKKEMKGRYPKHPWPDNPMEAQATRFTKKRSKGS